MHFTARCRNRNETTKKMMNVNITDDYGGGRSRSRYTLSDDGSAVATASETTTAGRMEITAAAAAAAADDDATGAVTRRRRVDNNARDAARRLRLQLDDLMETTFVAVAVEGVIGVVDDFENAKLEKFLLLVSQYSDDAIKLCITMTKPTTTTTTTGTGASTTDTALGVEEEEEEEDHDDHDENERRNNEQPQPQQLKPLQQDEEHDGGRDDDDDDDDESTTSEWYSGRLPIHLACDKSAPVDVIRWLLDHDPTKHTIRRPDRWGDLPIHTVCSRAAIQRNIVEIVKLLLEADDQIVGKQQSSMSMSVSSRFKTSKSQPKLRKKQKQLALANEKKQEEEGEEKEADKKDKDDECLEPEEQVSSPTLFTEDNDGNLPIHMACRYLAPPDVVKLLLEHDRTRTKESLRYAGSGPYPQIPLAVACRCQAPVDVVKLLLEYDVTNQTVITQDETTGRLPVHIALVRPSPIQRDVVKLLLDKMVCGRMEQVGIRKFKHILKTTIIDDALTKVHERDWNVRDKLDVIKYEFETLLEQVHVMELVLWKIQCWMQVVSSLNDEENDKGSSNETDDDEVPDRDNNTLTKTSISITTAPLVDIKTKYGITDDVSNYKKQARVSSGWTDTIVPRIMSFLEGDIVEKIVQQLW